MRTKKLLFLLGSLLCAGVLYTANSWSKENGRMIAYQLTITNLTQAQPFAPVLVTTHQPEISFFKAGEMPSPELAALAESGNSDPLSAKLMSMSEYSHVQVGDGIIAPGETKTISFFALSGKDHLSLGAMLVNTNDAFFALRDVALPKNMRNITYFANVYDAGSETNDESCSNVPGPACGGAGPSPEDKGEGFVHIHNGIHGIGDLAPEVYDWRNPAAQIVVNRMD